MLWEKGPAGRLVAGGGIVVIRDGADHRELTDLAFLEPAGIAAAVVVFVVLLGQLDRLERHAADLVQDLNPVRDVAFDQRVLRFGQAPGLMEQLIGDFHLADVVHQRAHPQDMQGLLGKLQLTSQVQGQDAGAQAVKGAVFVLVLEMREPDQGVGLRIMLSTISDTHLRAATKLSDFQAYVHSIMVQTSSRFDAQSRRPAGSLLPAAPSLGKTLGAGGRASWPTWPVRDRSRPA